MLAVIILPVDTPQGGGYHRVMTMPSWSDGTLATIDQRLQHVERQVQEIHVALVGATNGSSKGLQARVERLESWASWLAGVLAAIVATILGAAIKGRI